MIQSEKYILAEQNLGKMGRPQDINRYARNQI
jgi:hypothetical protein